MVKVRRVGGNRRIWLRKGLVVRGILNGIQSIVLFEEDGPRCHIPWLSVVNFHRLSRAGKFGPRRRETGALHCGCEQPQTRFIINDISSIPDTLVKGRVHTIETDHLWPARILHQNHTAPQSRATTCPSLLPHRSAVCSAAERALATSEYDMSR